MRRVTCHAIVILSVLGVGAACTPEEAQQVLAASSGSTTTTSTTAAPGPSCCTDEQARWISQSETERRVRERFGQHPLRPIAGCESSREARPEGEPVWDRYYHDQPNSSVSTASGGLQVLDSTWSSWRDAVPEARGYARAAHAPDWVQMEVGMRAYDHTGSTPWRSSRGCWG